MRVGEREILKGLDLHGAGRRSARDHGPERLGQEHARAGARRPRGLRSHGAAECGYGGQDLLAMAPEERARAGVFLAFQYPIEIPGVNNAYLLKAALNAQRQARGEQPVDAFEFMKLIKNKMELMQYS